MDGFSDLPAKIFSQCGLISGLLGAAVFWLSVQLAKTRAAWESDRSKAVDLRDADRSVVLKLIDNRNDLEVKLATAVARVESLVLAVRSRGDGN